MRTDTLTLKFARSEDLTWINPRYEEVGFLPSDDADIVVIAEVGGKPAGIGRLVPIDSDSVELGGIHVLPEFRGRGVARQIVRFLISQSPKPNVYCIPFQKLTGFYLGCGFELSDNDSDLPSKLRTKLSFCRDTYPDAVRLLLLQHEKEGAVTIRNGRLDDYPRVITIMDYWFGGRNVSHRLTELFFIHFAETAFVAEEQGELVGFLNGFLSQTHRDTGYIHFVGVHPRFRNQGLGQDLYKKFFEVCHHHGRRVVSCITSPQNRGSIAFHTSLGFSLEPGDIEIEGIPVTRDYAWPDNKKVKFRKVLD